MITRTTPSRLTWSKPCGGYTDLLSCGCISDHAISHVHQGCTLRNTDWAVGVVVFTGMDTKVMKNARDPPSKRSRLEIEMNRALITIFLFAIVIDFIGAVISGAWSEARGFDHWYVYT